MKSSIKRILSEDVTKSDITKSDVTKEVKNYIDSAEFKAKIEKIVKEKLKDNRELDDKTVDITKNVLTQLFKALWVKRNMWQSDLKNKTN